MRHAGAWTLNMRDNGGADPGTILRLASERL
jgi:hypothetical protein